MKPAILAVDDDAEVLKAVERDLRNQYGRRQSEELYQSCDLSGSFVGFGAGRFDSPLKEESHPNVGGCKRWC